MKYVDIGQTLYADPASDHVSFTSFHKVDLNNAWETFHLPIRNCMCKSFMRRVDPEERNTVQSTLALRTSRYYGPVITDMS